MLATNLNLRGCNTPFSKKTLSTILVFFLFSSVLLGQTNKSPKDSYRDRAGDETRYSTQYDNGYVILRDGTKLNGEISIRGNSYENLHSVYIRTNTGKKYTFALRSLREFGLENLTVNETPNLFQWVVVAERRPMQAPGEEKQGQLLMPKKDKRMGYADFGYVNLMDGKKVEGRITLSEVNGRLESIDVKEGNKNKLKLETSEVKSYGALVYADPKFKSPWSLVTWKIPMGAGMLVNIKSNDMPGYVITNSGEKQLGSISIFKKEVMVTQVQLTPDGGKSTKIKYNDIQSYGVDLSVKVYYDILKNGEIPFEEIRLELKFFPGSVTMVDETVKTGLIARAFADNNFTDIYFAANENALAEVLQATDIEEFDQQIPQEVTRAYNLLIYTRDHIKGFQKQRPPQWIYTSRRVDGTMEVSTTEFQPGYLIMANGEQKIGALSKTIQGTITRYEFQEGDKKSEKYSPKDITEFGLIVQESQTAFPGYLFSKRRSGFIQLLGSQSMIEGELQIKEEMKTTKAYAEAEGGEYLERTFIMTVNGKKEEHPEASVEVYGLRDVPVNELTRDGLVINVDPKQNFHPGSFTLNGSSMKGYIAWAPPDAAGTYDAFFFSPEVQGKANIYYTSKGSSNVNQTIEQEIAEYDPLDDSFLKTMTINKDVKNNGYVITSAGDKIAGEIQLSFPPKLWYATDVTVTQADGTVTNFGNDGSLKDIVVTIDGKQQEFIRFKNEYAEVLQREGSLVHFRNPHPTTPTFASAMLNQFLGAAANAGQEEVDKMVAEEAVKRMAQGKMSEDEAKAFNEYMTRDKKDYTLSDMITLYAKEHIVMNDKDERHVMYIPGNYYRIMDGELMGCIEYLELENSEQRGLSNMRNPVLTMQFINTCMAE